jgi:DNA repair protein RAD16
MFQWSLPATPQALSCTDMTAYYIHCYHCMHSLQDTIEERILKLQDKKKLVFDSTVGGDAASMAKLTVDDLRFLFSAGGGNR